MVAARFPRSPLFLAQSTDPNVAALIVGVLTLVVIFTWPKNLGSFVPGPLAALIIGTLASFAVAGAPVLGDIPTGLPTIHPSGVYVSDFPCRA